MNHPSEGRLRALLDDELPEAEAREVRGHLASCSTCDRAMKSARETQVLATTLLGALDVAPPAERVRARLTEHRRAVTDGGRGGPRRFFGLGRSDLARAALLLLVFSGALAAAVHPESPVRRWFAQEEPVAEVAPTPEAAAASAPLREVGVRLAVAGGGIDVGLANVPSGTRIEVTWVEAAAAAVYAPEGTSFTTAEAEGRIEARLSAAGPVRVELPRDVGRASLAVDGVRYLEKTGERIDFPGPAALVEGSRIGFRVP